MLEPLAPKDTRSYKGGMSKKPEPDLYNDYRVLTLIHWMMVLVAAALLWVMIPMLGGGSDRLATPVGLAGLVVAVASMWYAGSKLTDKQDGGPRLAYWGRSIRVMAIINIMVSLVLIALPRLPL